MYQSHCQLLAKIPADSLVETWSACALAAPQGVVTTGFLDAFLIERGLLQATVRNKRKRQVVEPTISYDSQNDNSAEMYPSDLLYHHQPFIHHSDETAIETLALMATPPRLRKTAAPRSPIRVPSPLAQMVPANSQNLPYNDALVFELARGLGLATHFDFVAHSIQDFIHIESEPWFGRIFCNLTECLPFSTANPEQVSEYGGIERFLQTIFTRFAKKDYAEGIFVIRAEFGADWFTPILQHPFAILRHLPISQGNYLLSHIFTTSIGL